MKNKNPTKIVLGKTRKIKIEKLNSQLKIMFGLNQRKTQISRRQFLRWKDNIHISLNHPLTIIINSSDELFSLVPRLYKFKCITRLADRFHHFTLNMASYNRKFYANGFVSRTSRLWTSLPTSCFLGNFNCQKLKWNLNRYLLSP